MLDDVRKHGWEAVEEYSHEYDDQQPAGEAVSPERLTRAFEDRTPQEREAFQLAAERIRRYQRLCRPRSRVISDGPEGLLGQVVRPMDTVGCYVPGGRVPLPSTVLMTALVARVAGVKRIVLCSPPVESSRPHPAIQAAASLVEGVEVYGIGGVQAIGAMTYGAGPVPAVDMIAGPGNLYVTLAKREVFGTVQVDMLAGPSEIAILAESSATKPGYLASDLLAQAEHDPSSRVFLLTPEPGLIDAVESVLGEQLRDHPRQEVLERSLEHSALVELEDLDGGIEWINQLAPEHLELHLEAARQWSRQCRHAGAVFLGTHSPEAVGDYLAGPSHTLPTGGSARFFSALSADSFCRRQSLIDVGEGTFARIQGAAGTLADVESLTAHERSLDLRS